MNLMKTLLLSTLLTTSSAFAVNGNGDTGSATLGDPCLSKVVSAVNKHHTLAEGSVYALRVLYSGTFGSAILVGHSDETEPTDYLVTVDYQKNCKIASIVYTDESGDVSDYTDAEKQTVSRIYDTQEKDLIAKGIELINKVPSSDYDTRQLCIIGDNVIATVPMTHWSAHDRKLATGKVDSFPMKIEDKQPTIKITKLGQLVSGQKENGIYSVSGTVGNKMADICFYESKPVLE